MLFSWLYLPICNTKAFVCTQSFVCNHVRHAHRHERHRKIWGVSENSQRPRTASLFALCCVIFPCNTPGIIGRSNHGFAAGSRFQKEMPSSRMAFFLCHVNTMDRLPNLEHNPAIQRSDCGVERRKTFAVEAGALARLPDIQRSFLSGAGYGSRTRLSGLGSRCTTDVRTLHLDFSGIIPSSDGKCNRFLSRFQSRVSGWKPGIKQK